jgi:heme exporter protein A
MLKVTGLSFAFQNRALFRDVNFSVRKGEFLHLKGPNGAGKTTLLSVLAGLLAPSTGSVSYAPDGGSNEADDRRTWIEYLPAEANGLWMRMDALANLRFWTQLRGLGLSDDDLRSALREWDLDHAWLRFGFPVEKFSTGMKRRLALTRVGLAARPCWLLDEPLYGLDDKAIDAFRTMIRNHLASGGHGVIISHDMAPIREFVTSTVIIGGTR